MKQKEVIDYAKREIRHHAYCARIFEELKNLKFDIHMMEYYENTENGKAFGQETILAAITEKHADDIYEAAEAEAIKDIREANYDIIKLLDLAGFDGKAYYEVQKKYA